MAGRSVGFAPRRDTSAITRNATVGARVTPLRTRKAVRAAMTIPILGVVRGAHLTGAANHARAFELDCSSLWAVRPGANAGTCLLTRCAPRARAPVAFAAASMRE